MSFAIQRASRVSVCCPVTYHVGDFEGHGMVWNCSLTGWPFSGNLPLREADIFSLTVILPSNEHVYVRAASVCWVRGEAYGADMLSMDAESREVLENYLDQGLIDWMESHW